MAFLPSLRRTSQPARYENTALPVTDTEAKIVLADYYAALVNAGLPSGGRDRARPWDVERAVAEGYERIVWTFAAVEAISGSQGRLRFGLRDGKTEVTDHPLVDLLNKGQANPMETGHQLRKRIGGQVLLSKPGSFIEASLSRRGTPYRYDLLPPSRTRIIPGTGNDLIDHYELRDLGGRVVRRIEPHRVRWIRDPHLLDPYSGITPLEAAGLSIELDYFARLYNVSFMRNDGRPGGVLGVDGEMDEKEMDRVEARFGKGPVEAGKLSVINGAISYVDTAAKPRDLQYGQTSKNAKTEILVAFGTPESQLGNAADRTWSNAKEEGISFWTVRPMPNHLEVVLNGFAQDCDGLEPFFDTSTVRVIEELEAAKRTQAREEFTAGLRSVWSYAKLAGLTDDVEENAQTRALWIPSGKTPIPSREEDAAALGIAPPIDQTAGGAAGAVSGPTAVGGPGDTVAPGGPALDPGAGPASTALAAASAPSPAPGARTAGAALAAANGGIMASLPAAPATKVHLAVVRETRTEAKAVSRLDGEAADEEPARESATSERLARDVEDRLAEAFGHALDRLIDRTVTRIRSPKSRKGTRHFEAQYTQDTRVDSKALDVTRIIDEERFAVEVQSVAEPLLDEGMKRSTETWVRDLGYERAVEDYEPEDQGDPSAGQVGAGVAATAALLIAMDNSDDTSLPLWLLRGIRRRALPAIFDMIGLSATRLVTSIADLVNERDQAGDSIADIVAAVQARGEALKSWARTLGTVAATGVTEGSRDAAAEELIERAVIDPDVARMWLSRRDDKVRDTHRDADGQRQPMGSPFIVGVALLRFPGDPLGPASETRNCRCRTIWKSKSTGRFVVPREVSA